MFRALPVLVALTASVCLPDVLHNSPWSQEIKSSFDSTSRASVNRPRGLTSSRFPNPDASTPPKPVPVTLTVTWESAAPVLEARKALQQPARDISYTISVAGIPSHLIFRPELLKDQASLKSGRRQTKPTEVRILPTTNTQTIYFTFPKDFAITPEDREVTFRCFLLTSEISVKFQPPKMLHEGQLRL